MKFDSTYSNNKNLSTAQCLGFSLRNNILSVFLCSSGDSVALIGYAGQALKLKRAEFGRSLGVDYHVSYAPDKINGRRSSRWDGR